MRAVTTVALLALFALSSTLGVSASLQGASNNHKVASKQSPWKIIEAWTKQMPGGAAMQISPVYTATKGIYFTTSADGTVYALNTTSREVLWNRKVEDITFIQAIDGLDGVVIGRGGATDMVQASSGGLLWSNSSIVILPDTSNHGDRNFILFGNRMVYREKGLSGFTRVCTLDIFSGLRYWCDTMRIMGLPDAAFNDTFTAPLFDSTGQSYAANFDVHTGWKNWITPVDKVLTGNQNYVAVANGTSIFTLDSMTGAVVANVTVGTSFTGTSTLVHTHILAVCDGQNWVAGFNAQLGYVMWNVSTPVQRGTMQLQHRGDGVLVLAVLTQKHTNFTRFDAYEGNFMWTVSARPTGTSLAPVHAWLGNDIIYVRDVTNSWSAYGVDTGDLISTGSGNLFLPRSVAADIFEPHVGYFVTGPEGIVYDLKIVPRN